MQHRRLPAVDDQAFPVSDAFLSRLYRADMAEVVEMARGLAVEDRARLAVFCFSRTHLREIGSVIAGQCDADTLARHAGPHLARNMQAKAPPPEAMPGRPRPKVSLATAEHMQRRPMAADIDPDDESE